MLVDELHGHAAAERLADDRRARNTQLVEQVTQPHRERAERVVAPGLGGLTVPQQVGRDDAVFLATAGGSPPATSPELPAIPWISSNVSPLPTSRYATRSPCSSRYFISPMWTGSPLADRPVTICPETATGKATSVGSRAVRTGGSRRDCPAVRRGSHPRRRCARRCSSSRSSSSEPRPLPRNCGSTLSDSISPMREPVSQVSGIHVSSTARTCASP